jgi:DNA-binding transcriptional LysR family regulator
MLGLKRLRAFVVAAEELNVGRAAHRLHIAQPALTRQLRALECEVGVQLFERHARGVRLTPAGAAFLDHARRLLLGAEAAVCSARETAARGRVQLLRLSPPDWPNRARPVQLAIELLRDAVPDVEVEYDMTPWTLHARALLDGTIDVGFGIAMHPSDYGPDIAVHRLADEPAASAVIRKTHPLGQRSSVLLRDLRDVPLLVPAREAVPVLHDQMVAAVRAGGYEPRVITGPPSFALAAQMIVAGAGWTIATHSVGEEPPHGVAVIPIEDAQFMLGFYALHRASDDRALIRSFVSHVQRAMSG